MKFNLNYLADQFVFYNLQNIKHGYLQIIDSSGKEYFFGNIKSKLKAKLKINSPSFSLKILQKGSSGLGESYMNNEFETENLSSLIDLTASSLILSYRTPISLREVGICSSSKILEIFE